jgi:hypothetical protein
LFENLIWIKRGKPVGTHLDAIGVSLTARGDCRRSRRKYRR